MAKAGGKGGMMFGSKKGGAASKQDATAMRARARLAGRAKRNRFMKENKKRIILGLMAFVVLAAVLVLSPIGQDMYYQRIEENRFSTPGTIAATTGDDLLTLGRFYGFTFRPQKMIEMYDEIGSMYYGFTFSEYMVNPENAEDKRFEAERLKKRGERSGPPYALDDANLRAVGASLYFAAEWTRSNRPKQFAKRLFDLYVEDFYVAHPEACDPATVGRAKLAADRLGGRR